MDLGLDEKSWLRLRNWFIWLVPLILIGIMAWTDPDKGFASTFLWALRMCIGVFVVVALAHLVKRYEMDYPEADFRSLLSKARETPEGAGRAAQAIAIIFGAVLLVISAAAKAQDVRTFIPANCLGNMAILEAERARFWPDHPRPGMLEALAEHESCVSLKSARCCNTKAQLKTQREEGASILQITRAYRADGSLRFDALAELKQQHPALADWSWENVYQRPDLANRALVMKMQDNYKFFIRLAASPLDALDMADVGYNAGNGRVQSDRRLCGLSAGCNPRVWVDNVERHCTASKEPLYAGRSACDIMRHHMRDVVFTRTPKYAARLA